MAERSPVSQSGTGTHMTPGSVMRKVPAGAAETGTTTQKQGTTASQLDVPSPTADTWKTPKLLRTK